MSDDLRRSLSVPVGMPLPFDSSNMLSVGRHGSNSVNETYVPQHDILNCLPGAFVGMCKLIQSVDTQVSTTTLNISEEDMKKAVLAMRYLLSRDGLSHATPEEAYLASGFVDPMAGPHLGAQEPWRRDIPHLAPGCHHAHKQRQAVHGLAHQQRCRQPAAHPRKGAGLMNPGLKPASDFPDKTQCINRFALNEEGELGFLTNVKVQSGITAYSGFELARDGHWTSINPLILGEAPTLDNLLDCAHTVNPQETAKYVEFIPVSDMPPMFNSPFDKKIFGKLTDDQVGSFHSLLNDLMNPKEFLKPPENQDNPAKDWEFRLDENDESEDNK